MKPPLPPLPDDVFDGEKQKTEVKFQKCDHSRVYFQNGELRCPCGAAWTGPGLNDLYKLLHKS